MVSEQNIPKNTVIILGIKHGYLLSGYDREFEIPNRNSDSRTIKREELLVFK